jgi:hypothetical protein
MKRTNILPHNLEHTLAEVIAGILIVLFWCLVIAPVAI